MITLTKRLRQESEGKPTKTKKEESRVSIRDKLLVKEVLHSLLLVPDSDRNDFISDPGVGGA